MIYVDLSAAVKDLARPGELEKLLRQAAQTAISEQPQEPEKDLTILLTDDEELHAKNRRYLGIDAPTDVLSFTVNEIDPESGHLYLGDILLSYPRAQSQASAAGHALEDELRLLVVHGVLHLTGHDHDTEENKRAMWMVQRQALQKLGSALLEPGESIS